MFYTTINILWFDLTFFQIFERSFATQHKNCTYLCVHTAGDVGIKSVTDKNSVLFLVSCFFQSELCHSGFRLADKRRTAFCCIIKHLTHRTAVGNKSVPRRAYPVGVCCDIVYTPAEQYARIFKLFECKLCIKTHTKTVDIPSQSSSVTGSPEALNCALNDSVPNAYILL